MNQIYTLKNKSKKRWPEKSAVTGSKTKVDSFGLRKKAPKNLGLRRQNEVLKLKLSLDRCLEVVQLRFQGK